jgi:hypothetical protein
MPIDRQRRRWVAALAGSPFAARAAPAPDWQSQFGNGLTDWGPLKNSWGLGNHEFLADPATTGRLLRVRLRRGSIDPGSMLRRGLPRSGTGFKAAVIAGGAHSATLNYKLRFAPGFDFVRGGKLPGMFGGIGNSGGAMPTGHDGFSLRLMWRRHGDGEVYAYLPTSQQHGSSLLRGAWRFEPGRWHTVTQQVLLNSPGHSDGVLRMSLDGQAVGEATGLRLRDTFALRLDGVLVDIFFGGSDDSWAASADTHIDLAEFSVRVQSR